MTAVYVANATKQHVDFTYRLPEQKGAIQQRIPIGGQVKLTPDMTPHDIEALEAQYTKYGLVRVENIDLSRGAFTGLCMSIGKPVSVDRLRRAMERNDQTLEAIGRQMRTEAAVAVNNQLEEQAGTPLKGLEMSVTEVPPPGGFRDDNSVKHISEGVRVSRAAEKR